MPQTRRLPELSRLNVLFCLLVVWIHVSSQAVSSLDRGSWQFALVYIPQRLAFVAVPGFFLLSGLKLTLPRPDGAPFRLIPYWTRRVRTILVPYLIAVTVYYLNFVRMHYFPFDWKDLLGYAVRGDLSSPFYFVVTLVQFTLLVPVFRWLAERWSPVILLPFALVLTLISSLSLQAVLQFIDPQITFRYGDRVFTSYLVYYLAGCCIGRRYDDFLRLLRENAPLLAVLFVCFALWDGATSWALMAGVRTAPYAEPVHTLYILSAILFLFQRAAARRSPSPAPWSMWTGPATSSTCTTAWPSSPWNS